MLFYIYTESEERCVCVCACALCMVVSVWVALTKAELHVITLSDSSIRLGCFYLRHMQRLVDAIL